MRGFCRIVWGGWDLFYLDGELFVKEVLEGLGWCFVRVYSRVDVVGKDIDIGFVYDVRGFVILEGCWKGRIVWFYDIVCWVLIFGIR